MAAPCSERRNPPAWSNRAAQSRSLASWAAGVVSWRATEARLQTCWAAKGAARHDALAANPCLCLGLCRRLRRARTAAAAARTTQHQTRKGEAALRAAAALPVAAALAPVHEGVGDGLQAQGGSLWRVGLQPLAALVCSL